MKLTSGKIVLQTFDNAKNFIQKFMETPSQPIITC